MERGEQPTIESVLECFVEAYRNSRDRMVGLADSLYAHTLPPHTSAEDLAEGSFMNLLRRAGRSPVLEICSPGDVRPYWVKSMRNLWLDIQRRKESAHPSLSLDETGPDGQPLIQVPDTAPNNAAVYLVRNLIAGLTPEQREVLEMRLDGFEDEEIAAQLSIERGAVRLRAFRGRNVLRERLEAMGITSASF